MTYRQLATDCAIAILLAVPTVPLAKPSLEAPANVNQADADMSAAYFERARDIRRG